METGGTLEDQIFSRVQQSGPEGISNEYLIENVFKNVSPQQFANAVNSLCENHMIAILTVNNQISYVARDEKEQVLMSSMDANERLVYQHIKNADNQGIWMKDLLKNTNLHRAVATKTLKTLESKQIIKSVKSIKTPSKKIYMLYDLNPASDITGGSWFTDNELDSEFVNLLGQSAVRYVQMTTLPQDPDCIIPPTSVKYPTTQDVQKFIASSNLSHIRLSDGDVEELLMMLVYDRQLERRLDPAVSVKSPKFPYVYRLHPDALRRLRQKSSDGSTFIAGAPVSWAQIPCFNCPVAADCHPNGRISPANCVYMKSWLAD